MKFKIGKDLTNKELHVVFESFLIAMQMPECSGMILNTLAEDIKEEDLDNIKEKLQKYMGWGIPITNSD
jgi:hypothetical protein